MIQSLKLLQVNTLQLEQMLKTEMELNPVLETNEELEAETDAETEQTEEIKAEEPDDAPKDDAPEEELKVDQDEIDWEEYLEEGFELGGSNTSSEAEHSDDTFEPTAIYQQTLDEHLNTQIAEKNISPERLLLVQFIVGSLDPDGILRLSSQQIADASHSDLHEVQEALQIIWSLDPAGIGAQSLRDCLILQLRRKGREHSLALRVITEAWELFEKLKIPDIARLLNASIAEIGQAVEEIRTLHPKPGHLVAPERPSIIIPDLIVEKIDGQFMVLLNDRSVPSLHINKSYISLLRRGSTAQKDVKQYVREKLNSATWLIRSIEQRKGTMLKVMYAIIDKQKKFFEMGPPNLAPLKLQDIADIIEMHISTVSRVTSNKYVQMPYGIFELKYFFTESMGHDPLGGIDISAEKIKNRISELIESEPKTKPLSDQKIVDILTKESFTVARRTVAKYREALRILPARLRQKYE